MIVVVIIECFTRPDHRQRLIAKIKIFHQCLAGCTRLCDQMAPKIIMKDTGLGRKDLLDPLV